MMPSSQSEAQRLGVSQYFTGRSCKYGHVSPRQRSNGLCLKCHTLKQGQRNREKDGRLEPVERFIPPAYNTIALFGGD